jgi:hypothetical protein
MTSFFRVSTQTWMTQIFKDSKSETLRHKVEFMWTTSNIHKILFVILWEMKYKFISPQILCKEDVDTRS